MASARESDAEGAPASPRQRPRRYGRGRIALCAALEALSRLCGGRAYYRRRHLARRALRVRHEHVRVDGLPAGLEGFRVLQLSDLHAGPFLGAGDLAPAVQLAGELEPDLVVLTGDFISHRWSECEAVMGDLAGLRAKHGAFAVFGNHDYHGRQEGRIADALAAVGVRVLRDESVRIDTGAGALGLVGVEDLEESKRLDLESARAGLRPEDVELVLCHNPAGASAIERPGCAAILSGHTHGGQLDLPGLRRLGPPHPGDRVEFEHSTLIVSRGLGVSVLPLRIRSPAELVVVELSAQARRPCTAVSH